MLYKNKILVKKVLAIVVVTAMIFSLNTLLVFSKEKNKESIVLTNNKSFLKAKNLSENTEVLLDSKNKTISKLSLTKNDVDELKTIDGVQNIEKKITLSGNSSKDSSDDNFVEKSLFKDIDTEKINQWNLEAMGINDIDEEKGEKVKLELLDSGVSWSNDINVKKRVNLIDEDSGVNPLYEDFSQHGTGMAGAICAKDNGIDIIGVNPNVELYSVRALDSNIEAPLSRIIEGIHWGIENGMDIINMSFGTNKNSEILHTAIREAHNKGIVIVASSGNAEKDGIQYPAAYPEVISVGSQDANGNISDFTSIGDNLDVIAPGEDIETTGIFGTVNGTEGTSIATAQVSGVASLILEKDKTKSPDFVKKLIMFSSKEVNDRGIVTGSVDCNYAMSIYDEFARNYNEENVIEYSNPEIIEEYDTEGYVKGLWRSQQHIDTAETAVSRITSDSNNLKLIIVGARAADYSNVDGFELYPSTSALHGGGNYVANLKCAWQFVSYIDSTNSVSKAWDKADLFAQNLKAYKNSQISAEVIDELLSVIASLDMVDYSKEPKFNVTDKMNANDCKYKAIGLCFHMVADIFAHRTQVPTSYSDKFGNTEDFPSNSNFTVNATIKRELNG